MHADIRIPLYALLVVALLPAHAEPIYSWVDADGITHFSELPPPGPYEAMQLDLPPYPAASPPDDEYFSVINQAARMQAQRLERERLEAQRRQAEAEARRAYAQALAAREAAASPAQPPPASGYLYVPGYPYRDYYPRRHHRPRPEHRGNYPQRHDLPDYRLNRPPALRRPGYR